MYPTGNEREWTRQSLADLAEAGINVRYLVTDPDSSAFKAAQDLYMSGVTTTEPVHQLDTIHVNRNLRKLVRESKFSTATFSCKTLQEMKRKQRRLSYDLATRCQGEHTLAYKKWGGDKDKLKRHMSYLVDTLVHCYQGDHTRCKKTSLLCAGDNMDNWQCHRSVYLPRNFKLTLSGADRDIFLKCLNYRLGPQILCKTQNLFTTQKCEAVNRAISASAPKNITFARNHDSRIHCAVKRVNRGIGQAMYDQLRFIGANFTAGTRVTEQLQQMSEEEQKRKIRHQTPEAKSKRYLKRKLLYKMHDERQDTYKTGMMLEQYAEQPAHLTHHNYATRQKFIKTDKKNTEHTRHDQPDAYMKE